MNKQVDNQRIGWITGGVKMRKIALHIFLLSLIISIASVQAFGGAEEASNLKILDVQFEPIRQGKNILRVRVQNTSEQEQTLRIGIYTHSPDHGRRGMGWGTSVLDTVKGGETKWTRHAFKIQGPITDKTWLRLRFFNPDSRESRDSKESFEQQRYTSRDLEHYKAEERLGKLASETESKSIVRTFRHIQDLIRDEKYEQAWQLFTKDYQDAEFLSRGLEAFKRIMNPSHPMDSAFWWERADFLNLKPGTVIKRDGVLTLTATGEGKTWTIDFFQENGR